MPLFKIRRYRRPLSPVAVPTLGLCMLGLFMLGLLMALGLTACSDSSIPWTTDPETGRWYSKSQVAEGRQLFRSYCAECHGRRAQGAPDWHKPDSDGSYPPPPLDGSAHAWHHPYPMLLKTLREGSGGRMPGWQEQLSDAQLEATIAYFQSLWPDRAYDLWLQRHKR